MKDNASDTVGDSDAASGDWSLGKPNLVLREEGPCDIPAEGYVPYHYSGLPYVFLQDTWIRAIEIVPDNPRVVHHCNLLGLPVGRPLTDGVLITGKVPGSQPIDAPTKTAIRIEKGTMLALQIHYTTTGQPEKCRIAVGFHYAAGRIDKELRYLLLKNTTVCDTPGCVPPPGRICGNTPLPNYRPRPLFAHACARERHDVRGTSSRWHARTTPHDPQLQLRLATGIPMADWHQAIRSRDPF